MFSRYATMHVFGISNHIHWVIKGMQFEIFILGEFDVTLVNITL